VCQLPNCGIFYAKTIERLCCEINLLLVYLFDFERLSETYPVVCDMKRLYPFAVI
jgi:hypothetical protein